MTDVSRKDRKQRRRHPSTETLPIPTEDRSRWPILLSVVVVAIVARLVALRFQPFVTFDGTEYIGIADSLRVGRLVKSIFPPGYPLLIASARSVAADGVRAGALVSLALGALLPWATWYLAEPALGRSRAWIPALLVAVHPVLVHFSALTMSDSAFVFAVYVALALAMVGQALGAGLVFGVAYSIRPEGSIPYAVVVVMSAWSAWTRGQHWNRLVWLVLGFLLLAVPCWIYFHATHGVWTLTPKLEDLRAPILDWRGAEPRSLPPSAGLGNAPASLGGWLGLRGMEVLRNYPRNALTVARELLVVWPLPLLLLSALGLSRRRGLEAATLPHLVLLPLVGLSFQPRLVLVAVPALAILLSVLLSRMQGRLLVLATVLTCVGYGWSVMKYLPELTSPFDGQLGPARRAGEWITHDSAPADIVMGRKPFVAFYARRPSLMLPDDSYEDIVSGAQRQGVRYLVVEERLVETMREQLSPLIYDSAFLEREERLQLAYVGGDQPGFGVAVFRVIRSGEARTGAAPTTDFTWRR